MSGNGTTRDGVHWCTSGAADTCSGGDWILHGSPTRRFHPSARISSVWPSTSVAELPARSNYFLAQVLLGRYLDEVTVPDYLKEENFETIRNRLDRLTAVTADIGEALSALPEESIDCFALSNVFEYSPRELFDRSIAALVRAARPEARLSLRNLLAPRRLAHHPAFVVDAALSVRLRDADRGFIYSSFEAARVAPAGP